MSLSFEDPTNPIDRSMKLLVRHCPTVLLRLAGIETNDAEIKFEDANVIMPELRADHVCILSWIPFAVYLEYQFNPKKELLELWFAKCGALTKQLKMPVGLLAIYLQKGDYATFPDRYEVQVGDIKTQFHFTAVKLWEHESRIRSGELIELAPLLILFEDNPSHDTVREEIALIKNSGLPPKVQSDLLGTALILASRQFTRNVIKSLFEEEIKMKYETGLVDDWLEESKAEGELNRTRKMLTLFLTRRFNATPDALLKKIDGAEIKWCESLFDRAITIDSLEELGWEN